MSYLYPWMLNEAVKDEGKGNDQEEDAQRIQAIHILERPVLYIMLDHSSEDQENGKMPDI